MIHRSASPSWWVHWLFFYPPFLSAYHPHSPPLLCVDLRSRKFDTSRWGFQMPRKSIKVRWSSLGFLRCYAQLCTIYSDFLRRQTLKGRAVWIGFSGSGAPARSSPRCKAYITHDVRPPVSYHSLSASTVPRAFVLRQAVSSCTSL